MVAPASAFSFAFGQKGSLLKAELKVTGDWRGAPLPAVKRVCEVIKETCFTGYPLDGDGQPSVIEINGKTAGSPAIWLHSDHPEQATVMVDVGPAAWMQLAYQLGHELGHVLANSWAFEDKPGGPSQWLEESLVEAFSIANLFQLADRWKKRPPFRGDNAYGDGIASYAMDQLTAYEKASAPSEQIEAWLTNQRGKWDVYTSGQKKWDEGLMVYAVKMMRSQRALMAELNGLNRWPERTSLNPDAYIQNWIGSSTHLKLEGSLPRSLKPYLS